MPDKIVSPKTVPIEFRDKLVGKIAVINGVKHNAINLLKEIRLISGINSRSNSICYKSLIEFKFINKMIDKFKDEFELKGFKK